MKRYYYTSKKKGVEITCNACGKTIFLKRLKDRVVSGRAVQDEIYETPERPWTEDRAKKVDLCPDCSAIVSEFAGLGN